MHASTVEPPVRLDAGYLVVDRRAFALHHVPARHRRRRRGVAHTSGFASLSGVLRAICAERIGVAGRAAIPGPKRALELRKAGRWQEVLDGQRAGGGADARRARDRWLRGWRFKTFRFALRTLKRL